MKQPLLSIAMPSYNQVQFIEAAIDSVFRQSYEQVELIVADGGSSDGTVELLEKASEANSRIIWDSAPDNGPAEAVSRAFSRARGQVIGWLNSDDAYTPGTFETVVEAIRRNSNWIMCYGHGEHIDKMGNSLGRYPTLPPERGLSAFENGCFICQPTMFMKATAIGLLGPLDENLMTAFDYDYWIRAFKAFPERIGFIDDVLAQSRLHDDCITVKMRKTVALEGLALSHRHLHKTSSHWAITYLEELRDSCAGAPGDFLEAAERFLLEAEAYLGEADTRSLRKSIGTR